MNVKVKRKITRLGGEVMREIGVLLIVFAPLDAIFAPSTCCSRNVDPARNHCYRRRCGVLVRLWLVLGTGA